MEFGDISFEHAKRFEKKDPEAEAIEAARNKKFEKMEKIYGLYQRLVKEVDDLFLLTHNCGELSYRKTFKSRQTDLTRRKDQDNLRQRR